MISIILELTLRFCHGTASHLRNWVYRWLGVKIHKYCWLRSIEISRNWGDISLHGCAIDRGVVLLCSVSARRGKIDIGEGTYINRYTILDAHERIRIGREVMIGPHCFITDGNHGMDPAASVKSQPMTAHPVEIEDEVWIGAHVTILPGVRIGRGAVIGAGSVVTRNIPANSIAIGVPARVRRMRDDAQFRE
jgi:acetyltransferase-like isoleucine patch superfamily enzyme